MANDREELVKELKNKKRELMPNGGAMSYEEVADEILADRAKIRAEHLKVLILLTAILEGISYRAVAIDAEKAINNALEIITTAIEQMGEK